MSNKQEKSNMGDYSWWEGMVYLEGWARYSYELPFFIGVFLPQMQIYVGNRVLCFCSLENTNKIYLVRIFNGRNPLGARPSSDFPS